VHTLLSIRLFLSKIVFDITFGNKRVAFFIPHRKRKY